MSINQTSNNRLGIDPDILSKAWDGDSNAQLDIGRCYYSAVYAEDNIFDAFKWIFRSAEQGNMEAQFRLADLYALGQGIRQSSTEAYKWYIRSAIQGYKKALVRIHNLYQQDKKMYCRGKLNSEEELRERPESTSDERKYYYRELFEQRLEDQKLILSNIVKYFYELFDQYQSLDKRDPDVSTILGFLYQHGYGAKEVFILAVEFYSIAAAQGHRDAQYNLGYLYQHNLHVKFNYRLSIRWYRASATNGNIAAQTSLGYFYEKGLGTDLNYESAIYWYTKAAISGNSDAQLALGRLYRKGEGVEQNLVEAVKWYTLAAKQGNNHAQNCLFQLHKNGLYEYNLDKSTKETLISKLQEDIEKFHCSLDFNKLKKLGQHALRGDGNAMYEIGLKYCSGDRYFYQDKDIGFQWIKKAAKAGLEQAELMVSQLYEKGDIVDQDYHESSLWITKRARKGNSNAQLKLGLFYKNGLGVRRDPLEASKWFTFSSFVGNSDAEYEIGLLRLSGEGLRMDKKEAYEIMLKTTKMRKLEAIFILGRMTETGDTVAANTELAIQLYQAAARFGNEEAQFHLGVLYEDRFGRYLDLNESHKYYYMAALSGNMFYQTELVLKYLNGVFDDPDYGMIFNLFDESVRKQYSRASKLFQIPLTLNKAIVNKSKAIDVFIEASKNGFKKADYFVGLAYENEMQDENYNPYSDEKNLNSSYIKAIKWYSTDYNQQNPMAHYRLGLIYEEGKGVEKNLQTALNHYLQSYENGNFDAAYRIALMYLRGNGVPQNFVKAFHLFTEASIMGHEESRKMLEPSASGSNLEMLEVVGNLGYIDVQHKLGVFYQDEYESLAFKWFNLISVNGMTDAYYKLGIFYEEGRGTSRNYTKAMDLYKKAVDKNYGEAMYRLAQMYLYGKGTKVDYKRAFDLYSMAANQEHFLSRKFLNITKQSFSKIYEVEPDSSYFYSEQDDTSDLFNTMSDEFNLAILMYRHVAEQGNSEAQYMLGLVYEKIIPQSDYAEAAKWYDMAAQNCHKEAMYCLGKLYEEGLGVAQDYHKAVCLYRESSNQGNYDALYRLALAYEYGKGILVDSEKALRYYREAAKHRQLEAQHALGMLYCYGRIVQKDIYKALAWCTRSYSNGHDESAHYLYSIYDHQPFEMYFYERLFKIMEISIRFDFVGRRNLGYNYYTLARLLILKYGTIENLESALENSTNRLEEKQIKEDLVSVLEYLAIAIEECGYQDKDNLMEPILMIAFPVFSIQSSHRNVNLQFYIMKCYFILATRRNTVKFKEGPAVDGKSASIYSNDEYFQKAMQFFSQAASNGHRESQYYLGKMYLNGYGTAIDQYEAALWLVEAAERQHIEAQYELGMLYCSGINSHIDYRVALEYIKRAALAGHQKALFHIGWMYKQGLGFVQSEKEASEWFNYSLNAMQTQYWNPSIIYDLEEVLNNLDVKYLDDLNTENTADEFVKNLERRSYGGDKEANYTLYQMFLNGDSVTVNHSSATSYLLKGAIQGHMLSQEELALAYYSGNIVRKNIRLASLWFKKGVANGIKKLELYLAQFYHSGIVENCNFIGAFQLYKNASYGPHQPLALQGLGLLYEYGDGLKMNQSLAYRYYIRSFNEGNYISGYNIARMYLFGKFVKQDYRESIDWLERSKQESPLKHLHLIHIDTDNMQTTIESSQEARKYSIVTYDEFIGEIDYLLGKIYYEGLGVPRDPVKARSYFQGAIAKGNTKAKRQLDDIND